MMENYRTEIEWYPGKNLTQKVLRKKPRKGSRSPKPPITKTEDCESFFNFFNPPQIPDDEDDIDEDVVSLALLDTLNITKSLSEHVTVHDYI